MVGEGQVIAGRYRLGALIGRGGSGAVWRAQDTLLGRAVALKRIEIPPHLDETARARVRQKVLHEARACARLTHPGAVTVFDVVEDEGRPCIVMELVEAPSLAGLVRDSGPLPPAEATELGLKLLDTLEAAHSQGIVHRDIKPGNILVPALGGPKLADFGIASIVGEPGMTTSGLIPGSPAYMSPEQAGGAEVGAPSDLWSLGAALYFAVEGAPPFEKAGALPTMVAIVNEEPRPPGRAGPLAPVLMALLTKDPHGRPCLADARTLLQAAQRPGSRDVGVSTAPLPVVEARERPVAPSVAEALQRAPQDPQTEPEQARGRRPAVVLALVVLGVLAVVVAVVLPRGGGTGKRPTAQAWPPASPTAPSGWVLHTDPATGFVIARPPMWTVATTGTRTDIRDPASGTYLRVDHREPPGPSAVAAWQDQEKSFMAQYPGYQRLQLVATSFGGFPGALWEFTYPSGAATLHAADLGFITGRYGFALYFQTKDADWQRLQPLFDNFKRTFQPPKA